METSTDTPIVNVGVEKCRTAEHGEDCSKDEELGYQHTLMYGRYTQELSSFARKEAKRVSSRSRKQTFPTKFPSINDEDRSKVVRVLSNALSRFWNKTFTKFGEDWVYLYLFTLGLTMAILSFLMDWGVSLCLTARHFLYTSSDYHAAIQYFSWIILPILLVLFSSALVHIVAPQAIGSGIPEMKTILSGVMLKDYLSFRTLFAKVIGLVASLGSGMPLGKEGPFVHIASIVATQLAKLKIFKSIYENQSRGMEMLAAACAVGVACCFAAPVGGVLMSIEVTSVYFAVRDYWRGFFAASFGATIFRLLAVWFQGHETLKPVFRTYLGSEIPYDPQELIIFAFIGVIAGLIGALFVFLHRQYVLWMRSNKKLSSFLQKNRLMYPIIVSWFIATLNFPLGFGQFTAGNLTTHDQVLTLFSNFSWTKDNFTKEELDVIHHWRNPSTGIFINLSLYFVTTFFLSILASTLPVPSGNFVPVFKMGAAIGRILGETMKYHFPQGFKYSGGNWNIVPGAYAVVGAAAVSGAVTQTISVCVIVAEMTGQMTYIIPIMVAVLISNLIAGLLQPSIFDSIAIIKKLPYLPDFLPSGAEDAYNILVKDFMIEKVHYIWHGMSYNELKHILSIQPVLTEFPLVEHKDTKILLGSTERAYLLKVVERHIGRERKSRTLAPVPLGTEREMIIRSTGELSCQPSRFEVVAVKPDNEIGECSNKVLESHCLQPGRSPRPKKSILKKTLSFNAASFSNETSLCPAPYQTVTGVESDVRKTANSVFKRASSTFSVGSNQSEKGSASNFARKAVRLPFERVVDIPIEDQIAWEEAELCKPVDFTRCPVDPLPLNLSGQTTLLKIHSLFSLLRINRAYVTEAGRLTGVVAMRELRLAIEQCNAGRFTPTNAVHEQEQGHGVGV